MRTCVRMRWSNLSLIEEERARLPGYRDEAVVRHFDAPGRRPHDVLRGPRQVDSQQGPGGIADAVPVDDQPVPRLHPLVRLLPGGRHAGPPRRRHDRSRSRSSRSARRSTEPRAIAAYRRYVRTTVREHWTTVKPAFRVVLEDGTQLVTSGDHRFLSRPRVEVRDERGRSGRSLTPERQPDGNGPTAPISRSTRVRWSRRYASLTVAAIEPLGVELPLYDITTGTGDFIANGVVSHNCFARPTHTYLDFDAGEDFEREIVVKVNAPELLRAELARPSWAGEHVALGTNTDPYQWVEGRYRLMQGIWEAMRDAGEPVLDPDQVAAAAAGSAADDGRSTSGPSSAPRCRSRRLTRRRGGRPSRTRRIRGRGSRRWPS